MALWLTYLRGTIDSFTVLGKSLVVGRRPGMVARLCRLVENDNLFFVCFYSKAQGPVAADERPNKRGSRLIVAPSGVVKLVVACRCFTLLGPAFERSRSSAGSPMVMREINTMVINIEFAVSG